MYPMYKYMYSVYDLIYKKYKSFFLILICLVLYLPTMLALGPGDVDLSNDTIYLFFFFCIFNKYGINRQDNSQKQAIESYHNKLKGSNLWLLLIDVFVLID